MNKAIILFLSGLFTCPVIMAQAPLRSDVPPGAVVPGTIRGMVKDSATQGGIEYATVGVYRLPDSTFAGGTVTDPSGHFVIKDVPFGKYYLEASFIGYSKRKIAEVMLTPQKNSLDMGTILLHPDITQIEDVQIVAQSQRMEYKIDKKVVNVSQDIAAAGGTLVNVLENTPSVQVDVEGNVSLRGSGNFQLLVDGKPSIIQGSEGLQQIPASAVQSVEIITSPSAKYDPDGEAGIINVIMKKQKNSGVGGIVNVSAGTNNKYSADFLLNVRREKVNYSFGAEYANMQFKNRGESERLTYFNDTTTSILSDVDGVFKRQSINVKGGLDYYFTNSSSISIMGAIGNRKFNRDFMQKNEWFTNPSTIDSFYTYNNLDEDDNLFYNLNIDYQKKFDENGHNLQASLYYAKDNSTEMEDYVVRTTDANFVVIGSEPERSRSRTEQPEDNIRIELDYTRPLGAKKLELGWQSRWDMDDAEYIYEDFLPLGNEWIYNDSISNQMQYTDMMHSAYAIFSGPLSKFEYQLGLRAEYDNRSLKQQTINEEFVYEKMHFFPSVHLSRKLSEAHQFQASYSRRIQRPDERDLNPFKEYRGSNNVMFGNPALRPEFTNAFELNYQFSFKKGFVSFETYYRHTTDKITRISGLDSLNGQQVFTFTSKNADRDNSLGIELMTNLDLTKWWQVNVTGSVFRYELTGEVENESVSAVTTSWRTNFNTSFKMKWDTRLQLTGFYNGPSTSLQGEMKGFFVANLALRKDFMKKQLSATLSVRDLLGTGRFAFTSAGSDFSTSNEFRRESQIITLQLSYRINNYRQQGNRRGGEDQDSGGGGFELM